MWLFNNPPTKILKEKYGFEPDQAWFEHLQRSSVRFNSGGSGSFVSSNGLVLTNHHVGADALQKLSSKDKNYLAEGFYAKTQEQEVKCVDLELNVLMSIEDVTDRVNAAVPKHGTLAESEKARRAIMNTIEQESTEKTGLRSDVVTLYNGGQYHLYRYKKYTDVRLVFAPEEDAAFFGGDPDNFEYPRYDLDICFFRVYENGKPAKIEHYLQWAPARGGRRRIDLRLRSPGQDRSPGHRGPPGLHPRPFAAHDVELAHAKRSAAAELQPAERRERAAGPRGIVRHPEFAQGPDRPAGRAARSGGHGGQASGGKGPPRRRRRPMRRSAARPVRRGTMSPPP